MSISVSIFISIYLCVSLETTFNFTEYIYQCLLNSYQSTGFAITQVAVTSNSTKLVIQLQWCKWAFFRRPVIARQICKPLSHANGILKINWDLRGLWKGVGTKPEKTGVFIVHIATT